MMLSTFLTLLFVTGSQTKKYDRIINKIHEAQASYQSCKISNISNCSLCHDGQIERDLAPWSDGIFEEDLKKAKRQGIHYQIIDGQLYRQKDCLFPFRCSGIEHFILKFLKELPNTEFVINVHDYPQCRRPHNKAPVFSFSKVPEQFYDIIYPAWTFWEGGPAIGIYPTGIGRWDLQREKILAHSENISWDSKQDKAFFRGSRTSKERDPLILLSRRNPDLVDAQYTKNQAWKSDKDTLGRPAAKEVTFEEHCRYKYLFNFRGVAASFRFKHLFLCNGLVFHVAPSDQSADWIEFFYPALRPWIHYIPITQEELENVEFFLGLARENEELVRRIAKQGFETVKNHLRMEDVYCFWRSLLKRYSSLLKYEVKRDPNLMKISKREKDEL